MAKTNIFVEDAATSNELAYIKTSQNLLNKVTTQANCDAFIAAPSTYADPWQIVFLEARDTIWAQGNEYGTSEAEITAITNRLSTVEGDLNTAYTGIKDQLAALKAFVGAKPIDSRLQDEASGDTGGANTTVVEALTNVADNLESLDGRLDSLEAKGVAITENDAYLKITQSGDDVVTYTLATENLMSYTDINAAISGAIDNFNTNTVDPLESELKQEDARLAAYLNGLTTTDGTTTTYHPTVADYVTTYVSYAIDQVNNDASALEGRVKTIENNMTSYRNDIDALEIAYVVTAYQGTTNVTGTSISLANDGAITLKQAGRDIVTFNIPLDLVVESGSVIYWDGTTKSEGRATGQSTAGAGLEPYIELVLANGTGAGKYIYIPVKSLVDVYKGDDVTTTENNFTIGLTPTYKSYIDSSVNKVELAAGTNDGHIALTYYRNDTTTGTADIDLTSKFATKAQGDLADRALQKITINGQELTKSSYSYVLNGDNINVSYNTSGTAKTGTINEAIANIESKINDTQSAAVTSVSGTGVTIGGTQIPNTDTYKGNVTITTTGATVKSETLTGTQYAQSNQTIDANLTAIDAQVQANKTDIDAIKAALNWTVIS